MTETPEDQRAALIERIVEAVHDNLRNNIAAGPLTDYVRAAEAVLSLLESGRAGVWLVPAVGVLDTVGVVIRQLRDAKAALADSRALVEDFRLRLGVVLEQRDAARAEIERLRQELAAVRVNPGP